MLATADIGHGVQFYRRDEELSETATTFLADGIRQGGVSIVIATEAHIAAFDAALAQAGIDPAQARENGALVSMDAAATAARFTMDGRFDTAAFFHTAARLVRSAAAAGGPVRAFGELVSQLWEAGDVIGAVALETMWNDLRREVGFSLLCAYDADAVLDDAHSDALSAVCRLHTSVVGHFAPDTKAPRKARRLVGNALTQWGHDLELSEAIAVVVSELATNAVIHAQSPFSVIARADDQVIRVSVSDQSPELPRLRNAEPPELAGRGLQMVAALAGNWGVEVSGDRKTVWAQVAHRP